MAVQKAIVPATKAAGVNLFVPAEYGMPVVVGPNVTKKEKEMQELLTQPQTPFTLFYTSLFAEFLDFHNDEGYMVVGKGETSFSIAARTDVGRFVAHALSTAPKNTLDEARTAFETERLSPLQIHSFIEKKLIKKIEVRHIDFEENKKKFGTDVLAWIMTLNEDGRGVVGTEEEVQEKFFLDWNPAKYESFIQWMASISGKCSSQRVYPLSKKQNTGTAVEVELVL